MNIEIAASLATIVEMLLHHRVSYLSSHAIGDAYGASRAGHLEAWGTLSCISWSRMRPCHVLLEDFLVDSRPRLCNRLVFPLHDLHDFVKKDRILIINIPLTIQLWPTTLPVPALRGKTLVRRRR